MKKMIIYTMLYICSGFLYAMESNSENIINYKTIPPIILIKDDIYNRKHSQYTEITVAGQTEQSIITGANLNIKPVEGDVFKSKNNGIYILDPVLKKYFNYRFRCPDDPVSLILEGKKFELTDKSAWNYIDSDSVTKKLILTIEPMINGFYNDNKSYYYSPYRRIIEENKTLIVLHYFYGNEALEEGIKGLKLCYANLLEQAHTLFTEKDKDKNIAFPPLSTLLGMPNDTAAQIAVTSVVNFIKNNNNKNKYNEIQFVVEKEEDFNFYKKYLNELVNTHNKNTEK